jgi:hypothetical protein
MKNARKALLGLAAAVTATSAFAQGTIIFSNRSIDKADRSGTYDVPIWANDGDTGTKPTSGGAGTLPGGVTVALFKSGSASPLLNTSGDPAQTLLRSDANAQFFATASQTVIVDGVPAGSTAALVVKIWQGSSLAAAMSTIGQQSGIWGFTSQPLGGTPPGGGLPIPPPTMTGWGPEDGTGWELLVTPEPSTMALCALGLPALLLLYRRK